MCFCSQTIDESKQDNSGGGIRLNRLRKPGSDKKGKDSSPQVATSFAEGDLEKMRQAIQSLVQQTGPLGTCLDFIQEDISLMSGELHKWEEECRRYEADYDEARKKTKEKLIPLRNELDELNDQVFFSLLLDFELKIICCAIRVMRNRLLNKSLSYPPPKRPI